MKIKKVIIEGFHNVIRKEYDLSDVTYLHGRNGAGKSTVLQAIQLGLLGYVPGSNKTKQGIFSHSNNHTMAVKLILDDNGQPVSIQRVWTKSRSSVTESVDIRPEGYDITALISDVELPLFNFDEFTHMTANGLKNWFINYLPKSTFHTDWKSEMEKAVSNIPDSAVAWGLIDDAVEAISEFGLDGVEEVRKANEYFKNLLSFMKAELTRKTSTIQSLIHYDDYVETYSEEELKQMIASKESEIVQASLALQTSRRRIALETELHGLPKPTDYSVSEEDLESAKSELHEYEAVLAGLNNNRSQITSEIASLQSIIESGGICPYTSTSCESLSAMRSNNIERQKELADQLESIQQKIRELNARAEATKENVSKYREQLIEIQNDSRRRIQIEQELETLPTDSSSVDLDLLQQQLEELKEMYGKAIANRQYNELNDVLLQDKYKVENSIECLKLWVKLTDVNGLQANSGGENPFEDLTEHINAVLQNLFEETDVSCYFLNTNVANSFSFGLERNDVYVPYTLLSSGEKCRFILAMFIGLLNYTNSPLKVVLIDDFLDHLDDMNFKNLFDCLKSGTEIQYIFAGVKPVESDDCQVIEL